MKTSILHNDLYSEWTSRLLSLHLKDYMKLQTGSWVGVLIEWVVRRRYMICETSDSGFAYLFMERCLLCDVIELLILQ